MSIDERVIKEELGKLFDDSIGFFPVAADIKPFDILNKIDDKYVRPFDYNIGDIIKGNTLDIETTSAVYKKDGILKVFNRYSAEGIIKLEGDIIKEYVDTPLDDLQKILEGLTLTSEFINSIPFTLKFPKWLDCGCLNLKALYIITAVYKVKESDIKFRSVHSRSKSDKLKAVAFEAIKFDLHNGELSRPRPKGNPN